MKPASAASRRAAMGTGGSPRLATRSILERTLMWGSARWSIVDRLLQTPSVDPILKGRHQQGGPEEDGDELGGVGGVEGVHQVDGGQAQLAVLLEEGEDGGQGRRRREELHLPRHVEQEEGAGGEVGEGVLEPVQLAREEGEGCEEGAVGPEPLRLHHLLHLDQVPDVDVGGARGEAVVGGVEVDDGGGAALGDEVGLERLAVGRLAGAGRAQDQLPEARHPYGGRFIMTNDLTFWLDRFEWNRDRRRFAAEWEGKACLPGTWARV